MVDHGQFLFHLEEILAGRILRRTLGVTVKLKYVELIVDLGKEDVGCWTKIFNTNDINKSRRVFLALSIHLSANIFKSIIRTPHPLPTLRTLQLFIYFYGYC